MAVSREGDECGLLLSVETGSMQALAKWGKQHRG